jgi:hypothetical protein
MRRVIEWIVLLIEVKQQGNDQIEGGRINGVVVSSERSFMIDAFVLVHASLTASVPSPLSLLKLI